MQGVSGVWLYECTLRLSTGSLGSGAGILRGCTLSYMSVNPLGGLYERLWGVWGLLWGVVAVFPVERL
jgi:hypothetical protein